MPNSPESHPKASWSLAQVAALLAWFSTVAGCYALFIPVLPDDQWQASAAALYTFSGLAVFCSYFAVSWTNPSDESTDGPLFCDHCQAFAQRGSRHCKECRVCVAGFDHHCKWVNNCIGSKNYRTFMVLLTSMCAMMAVQLVAGIKNLVECFTAAGAMAARLQTAYPIPINRQAYIAALFCHLAITTAALWGLGDLWLLHLVLIARGMTTYDYIMASHSAALAAAAATAHREAQPLGCSFLAAWHKLRSLGFRSIRVRDESVLAAGTGKQSSSKASLLVLPSKKHHVSLTPCEACKTPRCAITAQHAAAYQQSLEDESLRTSPQVTATASAAAQPTAAGAFDAAAHHWGLQPLQQSRSRSRGMDGRAEQNGGVPQELQGHLARSSAVLECDQTVVMSRQQQGNPHSAPQVVNPSTTAGPVVAVVGPPWTGSPTISLHEPVQVTRVHGLSVRFVAEP